MDRRKFFRRAAVGAFGAAGVGGGYPLLETRWCRVRRLSYPLPNLPGAFEGLRVAFLADVHHGPYLGLAYVRRVVAMVNALRPDVIALGGDYVSKSPRYIAPCLEVLADLEAPSGRFAVLGNHDHWEGPVAVREGLAAAGFTRVDNAGTWLERGGARLRIGGVGDLWEDAQDLDAALGSATDRDAVLLLSHNPDYVEQIDDPRVGLVLSGHTHGGQVHLPGFSPARWAPSSFGEKYLSGLCRGPVAPVFVTTGVGTSGPPVRLFCPPEVVLLSLTAGRS